MKKRWLSLLLAALLALGQAAGACTVRAEETSAAEVETEEAAAEEGAPAEENAVFAEEP